MTTAPLLTGYRDNLRYAVERLNSNQCEVASQACKSKVTELKQEINDSNRIAGVASIAAICIAIVVAVCVAPVFASFVASSIASLAGASVHKVAYDAAAFVFYGLVFAVVASGIGSLSGNIAAQNQSRLNSASALEMQAHQIDLRKAELDKGYWQK